MPNSTPIWINSLNAYSGQSANFSSKGNMPGVVKQAICFNPYAAEKFPKPTPVKSVLPIPGEIRTKPENARTPSYFSI